MSKYIDIENLREEIKKIQKDYIEREEYDLGWNDALTYMRAYLYIMGEKPVHTDNIIFPVDNIIDLASTLMNLSNEDFNILNNELDREYSYHIELLKNKKDIIGKQVKLNEEDMNKLSDTLHVVNGYIDLCLDNGEIENAESCVKWLKSLEERYNSSKSNNA